MCRNLPKYTLIERLALMVKAWVCAVCLGCSVQTAYADEFVVNEKIMGQRDVRVTKMTKYVTSPDVPLKEFLGKQAVYCRFVLFDAETEEPLYELSKTCFRYDASQNWVFQQTDYGLIEFPRRNATFQNYVNPQIVLPKGRTWNDFYVGVYYCKVQSGSGAQEIEVAKKLGINGDITYHNNTTTSPTITSDPFVWTGFCASIFIEKELLQ